MVMAKRVDGNQAEIVRALRGIGASVVCTHTLGQGMTDLVVDYHGRTCLMEIKDPLQPPSKRRLTPAQAEFHAAWTGPIYIVDSPERAVLCATGRPMRVTEASKGGE